MISNFFYSPHWSYVDRIFRDSYLVDLEEYVGGGYGHDWLSKAGKAEQQRYLGSYLKLQRQFNEETRVLEVLSDNFYRLTLLAGVERLLTVRQAYGGLKSRFTFADSNTACLQQIFNQGTFTGYFRGAILNAGLFLTNWAHPVFYSQGKGYAAHYLYSSIFEAITYPLDTVKTILYADIKGQYKGALDVIEHVYQKNGMAHFYQGILFKLAFNGALIFHLRNIYEEDYLAQALSLPILALSYGFLTIKTRLQIASTDLSFQESHQKNRIAINLGLQKSKLSMFRGVIPFLLLTDFFHYNLYGIYSKNAQQRTLSELMEIAKEKIGSPNKESLWF